ncbi:MULTISPECIES: hypothetical protein [unclassified Paenibacillus]|uniref:hypothetical protein n=1 Tax=unclassified Paenibacillus TaxID=185978 RepID=UPI002781277D|nr:MULTISPECIES: hypothetical protein [unclassified Paenibacillus]MDQ0896205.1 hypothetical protein [Paenibacillus sp. V4I7]MDQ0913979.1 hypothetical protein [Paenibacillus sp. V4I5]
MNWLTALRRRNQVLFREQRGGVHILLFSLLAILAIVWMWVVIVNWMLQTVITDKTKPLIDHATHAASLDIDPVQAAKGLLVYNTTAGTNSFYKYLRLNMRLDSTNIPVAGSYLSQAPVVHWIEFVTNPSYPFVIHRSIIANGGTSAQVTRNIDVTIYGPSVVAIVEIRQNLIGFGRQEPIVISSVANVRFR